VHSRCCASAHARHARHPPRLAAGCSFVKALQHDRCSPASRCALPVSVGLPPGGGEAGATRGGGGGRGSGEGASRAPLRVWRRAGRSAAAAALAARREKIGKTRLTTRRSPPRSRPITPHATASAAPPSLAASWRPRRFLSLSRRPARPRRAAAGPAARFFLRAPEPSSSSLEASVHCPRPGAAGCRAEEHLHSRAVLPLLHRSRAAAAADSCATVPAALRTFDWHAASVLFMPSCTSNHVS
jgi:hypothetical protein